MTGKFIVFEGLDGGGKTTVINSIMKKLNSSLRKSIFYHKGFWPKCIPKNISSLHNSTWALLIGLILTYFFVLKLELRKNKIILKDRYIQSLETYIPENVKTFNKLLIKLTKLIILKPYLFVYLDVSQNERINRLRNSLDNPYHKKLIENKNLIKVRTEKYNEVFENFKGKKVYIDTTNKKPDIVANFLLKLIKEDC